MQLALIFSSVRQTIIGTAVIIGCLIAAWDVVPLQAQSRTAYVYDKEFSRLAEILGALHYLQRLCSEETSSWRDHMNALLAAEKPDEVRRTYFIDAFNRSYRGFEENYRQCTPAAHAAIKFYTKEGEAISNALVSRYGN